MQSTEYLKWKECSARGTDCARPEVEKNVRQPVPTPLVPETPSSMNSESTVVVIVNPGMLGSPYLCLCTVDGQASFLLEPSEFLLHLNGHSTTFPWRITMRTLEVHGADQADSSNQVHLK